MFGVCSPEKYQRVNHDHLNVEPIPFYGTSWWELAVLNPQLYRPFKDSDTIMSL